MGHMSSPAPPISSWSPPPVPTPWRLAAGLAGDGLDAPARHGQGRADRARDERAHVGASGHPGQPRHLDGPGCADRRPERGGDGVQRVRLRADGGAVEILAAIEAYFGTAKGPLAGKTALTGGPTHEAIDPVRYIAAPPASRGTRSRRHSRRRETR